MSALSGAGAQLDSIQYTEYMKRVMEREGVVGAIADEPDDFIPQAVDKIREELQDLSLPESSLSWKCSSGILSASLSVKTSSGLIALTISYGKQNADVFRIIQLEDAEFSLLRAVIEVVDPSLLSVLDRAHNTNGSVTIANADFVVHNKNKKNEWNLRSEAKKEKIKELLRLCAAHSL